MTNPQPEQRPPLTPELTGVELQRWYWLKTELVGLARALAVSPGGGKQELLARLDGVAPSAPARPAAPAAPGGQLDGVVSP